MAIFVAKNKWKYLGAIGFIFIVSYVSYLVINPFITQNKIVKDINRLDIFLEEKYQNENWSILINGKPFNNKDNRYIEDQPYLSDTVFSSVSVIFSNEPDVAYVYRIGNQIQQVAINASSTDDLLHNEIRNSKKPE